MVFYVFVCVGEWDGKMSLVLAESNEEEMIYVARDNDKTAC